MVSYLCFDNPCGSPLQNHLLIHSENDFHKRTFSKLDRNTSHRQRTVALRTTPARTINYSQTIGIKIHVRNKPVEVYTLIQNWNVAFFLVVDGERRKTSFPALQFFFLTFLLHDKFQSGLDCAG